MSEIERTIRSYLVRACGNAGEPTDHTIRCFLGMIETGEADMEMFRRLAGEHVVTRIRRMAEAVRETA